MGCYGLHMSLFLSVVKNIVFFQPLELVVQFSLQAFFLFSKILITQKTLHRYARIFANFRKLLVIEYWVKSLAELLNVLKEKAFYQNNA